MAQFLSHECFFALKGSKLFTIIDTDTFLNFHSLNRFFEMVTSMNNGVCLQEQRRMYYGQHTL